MCYTLLMKKPQQLSFIKSVNEFGGSLLIGKRKEARPTSTKNPMHVILKSENARGLFSFINHKWALEQAIAKISSRVRIKIYDFAITNNHIHLTIYFTSRAAYRKWIRTVTAEIVRIIARRTKTKLKDFFTYRPYTKIVSWGRQFKTVLNYMVLNQMEYFGVRPVKKSSKDHHAKLLSRKTVFT